jgi:signal transduction histidine kinase
LRSERIDKRKNEFLAVLAHELRNPLAPIRNALQVLNQTHPDGPVDRPAIDMMQRQISQMVRLVDELLDASRVSRGTIELRREHVELTSLIGHAAAAARNECDAMRQELIITVPPTPIFVDGDRSGSSRSPAICSATPVSSPKAAGASSCDSNAKPNMR